MKRSALFISLLAAALLQACGGGSDESPPVSSTPPVSTTPPVVNPPPVVEPPPAATGTVVGRVTSSLDSTPIIDAVVSNGDASTRTLGDGTFELTGVAPAERTVLRVNADRFGEGLVVTSVVADQATTVTAQLYPVGTVQDVDPASAMRVTMIDSTASVELPANGLVRADGSPAAGRVTVALTPVAPAVDVNSMPGEYQVTTGNGIALMESWGALNVTLTDSDGERLNLAQGQQATIQIPLSSRSPNSPATIPLFYFDESIGYWRQEGQATLEGIAPNQYYRGTVSHFTYWNADQIMDTIFVNGCVNGEAIDGNPVAPAVGVRVTIDGIDYSNVSSAVTDANGRFRIPMKRNARGVLTAASGIQLTNSVSVGPSVFDIEVEPCLSLATLTDGVSIKLTWGDRPRDVDSHLFTPSGQEVYYANRGSLTSAPFAQLDVDDVSGFGPEVVTLPRLMVGTYTYALYNWSGTFNPGMTESPVRVELNQGGRVTAFTPNAGEVSGLTFWWTVFRFTVDSQCAVTVESVRAWGDRPSVAAVSPATPQYCTF